MKDRLLNFKYNILFLFIFGLVFFTDLVHSKIAGLFLVILSTLGILITNKNSNRLLSYFLTNRVMVAIGKISFSLYMWHHLVFAFSRYFIIEESSILNSVLMVSVTIILSILTYFLIEQPFRNKKMIKNTAFFLTLGILFLTTTGAGLYLHAISGVIKDVPELGIKRFENYHNTEIAYNERVKALYEKKISFADVSKIKILVIGNSFARDWINILLESKFENEIDIVYVNAPSPYIEYIDKVPNMARLLESADYIYITLIEKKELNQIEKLYGFNKEKISVIGIKNFGLNNGKFYNKKGADGYCSQLAVPLFKLLAENSRYKNVHGDRYIDIMSKIMDENGRVRVFGEDCRFISQDGIHLTKSGAKFFADILLKGEHYKIN